MERDSLPSCDECIPFNKRVVPIQYTKCLTGSYSFSQAGPAIKVAQSIDVINVNTLMSGRLLEFIPVPLSITCAGVYMRMSNRCSINGAYNFIGIDLA